VDCSTEPTTPVTKVEPVFPPSPPPVPQPHFGELSITVVVTGDNSLFPVGFEIWFFDVPFFAIGPNETKTKGIVVGTFDVRVGREATPDDDDLYGFGCLIGGCQYQAFQSEACRPVGPLSYRVTINENQLETVRFEIHCEKAAGSQ
jgi:hypothetical protein